MSYIEKSHRDPVYDVAWLAGKTAFEVLSTRPTARCSGGTSGSRADRPLFLGQVAWLRGAADGRRVDGA